MSYLTDPVPSSPEERREEIVRLFSSAIVRLARRPGALRESSEELSDSGRGRLELPPSSATHVVVR